MDVWARHMFKIKQKNPAQVSSIGALTESTAIGYLRKKGLKLISRNYRPPGRGMADLDAVMLDQDGTVVFVEVRFRSSLMYGGAAASISASKKQRLIQAARFFLQQYRDVPACRFDAVVFENGNDQQPVWIKSAFEAKV